MPTKGWKTRIPWLLLFGCILLPLYAMVITFAIRSGVFDLTDRSISGDEYKAFWAFLASGFATAATLIGLLLTRSANDRTANQLELDTAVKGLELLVANDGSYAKPAKVAGALAALVHLGHPVIAMRSLASAWNEGAVDRATACWLISEVFRRGSYEAMLEASDLLRAHARELCGPENQPVAFNWPEALNDEWPHRMPLEARYKNIESAVRVLVSRDRDWWGVRFLWILSVMYLAARDDEEAGEAAAEVLKRILPVVTDKLGESIFFSTKNQNEYIAFGDLRRVVEKTYRVPVPFDVGETLEELEKWVGKAEAVHTVE